MTDIARMDRLLVGPCWFGPEEETDQGRWVVQAADGTVSDMPAPAARRRLDRALALLAAEPRFGRLRTPTVQRAEVYEARPVTAPGHLYLRVAVTGAPEEHTASDEFWVCAGKVSAIHWQTGLIVVAEAD